MEKLREKFKKIGFVKIQVFSILLSLFIVFLGGVKMLAMTIIFIFGLLIGKFYEKTVSAIRDYRLMQKVNKIEFQKHEFETIKKENDSLKNQLNTLSAMVSRGSRVAPMPPTPPAYHSQDNYYYGGDV